MGMIYSGGLIWGHAKGDLFVSLKECLGDFVRVLQLLQKKDPKSIKNPKESNKSYRYFEFKISF